MKSKRSTTQLFTLEAIEPRLLFATDWGPTATLVRQDDAAVSYSSITGAGIGVAVIDSGINYNVPALGGGFGPAFKVVAGYDFVDDDWNPVDTDGHGTEVAGVIAANPFDYNGLHYSGVAPDAKLIALRVTHGEDGASDDHIEQALQWVINHHATWSIRVVNISLGSGKYDADETNTTLSDQFKQLADLNIVVFAASGNDGGVDGIAYPAADPSVISVGSVNSADIVSTFTQRAANLDLLAPGSGVATTARLGGYVQVNGTSFAAPYAAGTAALVAQASPGIGRSSIVSILRASGPVNVDGDSETGVVSNISYPRLDVFNALRLVSPRRTNKANVVGTNSGAGDIAYDASGVLHLAYYDGVDKTIRYATRDTDGFWSRTQIIDTTGDDVGVYLSIAVDRTGKPGIAYFDSTNADLKYANFYGANWQTQTVDSDKFVGAFPSLTYSDSNAPLLAYYRKSGGDLKLATLESNGGWNRQTLDSTGDVGAWTSIDVTDAGGGVYAIAYADITKGDLKYTRFLDGAWTTFVVDDIDGVGYTSLNIHKGQAFISYQDLKNGDLKFAKREESTWTAETVYTPGNTGQFTSLVFDADDIAHIAFWSRSKNQLFQAVGRFGDWTVRRVGDGGAWAGAAEREDEDLLSFVSLDISKRNLMFGALS